MANLKHGNKVFTIPNSRHLHLPSISVMLLYKHIISLPYTQGLEEEPLLIRLLHPLARSCD